MKKEEKKEDKKGRGRDIIHIIIYIHIFTNICVYIYICVYTHIYIYREIYTYTHTYNIIYMQREGETSICLKEHGVFLRGALYSSHHLNLVKEGDVI